MAIENACKNDYKDFEQRAKMKLFFWNKSKIQKLL